ncbi:MAG: LamG domain-containing protein [Candidatus Poribacteria bacterium]|nr:LamG domain-containing protein [Candidatus Poribacteria bacterium]
MKIIIPKVAAFVISLAFVGLLFTGAAHSQGLMSKAVAIWLFDEDGGKKVKDFARNNHEGEFEGKPEWVPGKFGTALKFIGADELAWVDIERPVVVDTVDFSIGCWLLPGSPQHWHQNVLSGRDAAESDKGIALAQFENAVNSYRIVIGGVFNWQGLGNPRNTARLAQDEWSHLVFVREGRGGTWYKNGEPDRPKRGNFFIDVGSVKPVNPPIENFRIGAASFNDELRYRGVIDEVFIFERALSQDEVQRIMNDGFEEAQKVDAKGKAATMWGTIKSSE